ncbi:hypothetical protein JCM21900_000331 [Sporobolomyces salmonicolor]
MLLVTRCPRCAASIGSLRRFLSSLPRPPLLSTLESQDDMREARAWIAQLEKVRAEDWPKQLVEASFARSSGPGGQHVNRTMSKAILRLPLPSPTLLPPYLLPHLRRSPHYVASPSSLLVSASTHRSQPSNLAECYAKLKAAVLAAARTDLVGETSAEQKERVRGLAARDKRRTEKVKKERKDVKSGRGKVRGWE